MDTNQTNPFKDAVNNIPHSKEEINLYYMQLIKKGIDMDYPASMEYFLKLLQFLINVAALQFAQGAQQKFQQIEDNQVLIRQIEFHKWLITHLSEQIKQANINVRNLTDNIKILQKELGI
jgi:hypothetical protein